MNTLATILAQDDSGSAGIIGFLPMILLGAGLVYMLVVPQRKQRAKQAELMAALEVGSEVITSQGMYGTINFIEDDVVHLEVDTDVVIRISKASIAGFQAGAEPDADPAEQPNFDAEG